MRTASSLPVVLTALTIMLGLQTLRAFFPLIVYVFGARPGISSVEMGLLAIGVFSTAWLAVIVVRRLGPRRAVMLTASVLAVSRLAAQFAAPGLMLWLVVAGTVAVLWCVPALVVLFGREAEGRACLAAGLLVALSLDVVISAAFSTWDLIWQRSLWPAAATVLIVAACGAAIAALGRRYGSAGNPGDLAGPFPTWGLAAVGPILLVHLLVLQNPARLAAVEELTLGRAAWRVLGPGIVAILLLGVTSVTPRAARWAGVLLVPLLFVAHGTTWDGMPFAFPIASFGVVGGTLTAAVVTLAAFGAAGRGGAREAAAGWAAGAMIFGVVAFLYYIGYDVRLAFSNVGLVPLLAAIAGLLIIAGLRRIERLPRLPVRNPIVTLLVLVPLLAIPLLMLTAGPSGRQEGTGFPVRVMAYNLHQGYGISGSQDLEALARTIEAAGADVVALQEVSRGWLINGSTDMLWWLSRRLSMHAAWAPAADAATGNAILARWPIGERRRVALPRENVPMRRGALSAAIGVGGGESLTVIAVHVHHIEAQGAVRERQVQALLAAFAPERQTVVLGDFNATRDAPEIAMMRQAGLRDAYELARLAPAAGQPVGDPGHTFPSDRPDRRIDYIWVTPDLGVRDFRVMPGQASDHRGITVTVDRAAR